MEIDDDVAAEREVSEVSRVPLHERVALGLCLVRFLAVCSAAFAGYPQEGRRYNGSTARPAQSLSWSPRRQAEGRCKVQQKSVPLRAVLRTGCRDIWFGIEEGEIFGFLGINGAGELVLSWFWSHVSFVLCLPSQGKRALCRCFPANSFRHVERPTSRAIHSPTQSAS